MHSPRINALSRVLGKAAIKAAVPGEVRLARKLTGLFADAERQLRKKILERGTLIEADAASILGAARQAATRVIADELRRDVRQPDRVSGLLEDRAFEASKRTMERLQGDVMSALQAAQVDGLGTRATADVIGKHFRNTARWELERIARTEVNGAQNLSTYEELQQRRVPFHQWITAEDERVRASHAELHGEVVEVGGAFSNGLKYPGDRSGPIEEWVNCRCVTVPVLRKEV